MKQETFDRLIMFIAFIVYLVLFEAWLRIAPDPGWGNVEIVFLSIPVLTAVIIYGLGWAFVLGVFLSALYLPAIWPSLLVGKISVIEIFMKFSLVSAMALGAEIFRRYEVKKRRKLADLAERLQEKVHQQQSLIKAQQALGADLDLKHQLEEFLYWATQLVSARKAYIAVYNSDDKKMEFSKSDLSKSEDVLPKPMQQIVAMSGDEVNEDMVKGFIDGMSTVPNSLCVPLTIEKHLAGSLCLISDEYGFSEADNDLVGMLGVKAQVAIENARLHQLNTKLFTGSIIALAKIIDARDPLTKDHSDQVTHLATMLAKELGYKGKKLITVTQAGELHDIGRIVVSDQILKKPGRLTKEEYEIVKKHPQTGFDLLQDIKAFQNILPAIHYHHERFDGKGYPMGIKGEDIPLIARIISVADVFEALTSDRAHRGAISDEEAIKVLKEVSGSQLDPELVDAFCRVYPSSIRKKKVSV